MPDFRLPTTPEEWAAIKPNDADIACAEQHMRFMNDGHEPYAPAVYSWAKGMAVARLLERARCVAALAVYLGPDDRRMRRAVRNALAEARRILEDK